MANSEAGSAYISIIPSMKGFDSTIGDGLGKALSAGAKVATAAVAAVGGAVVAVGKQALDSYSDYEQLTGGVAKLFGNAGQSVEDYAKANNKSVDEVSAAWQRNESAQATVMRNAQNAYKTAGMSANQYMEQATSFSAALINSLGGDTQKAADMTQVAMTAMSDNINTFGSNAEDVQNAFNGFAKQNYTMLDNLKLGYGGTKSEMERLIKDANEWGAANGEASDLSIDSFADVVQAIQQIQEKQQIAGTTAREAATTIEGSIGMAKAAWENWLTGLADEDADMGQLTQNLIESIEAVASNVGPRVQIIAERIIENLPQVAQMVGEAFKSLLSTAITNAWNAIAALFSTESFQIPTIDTTQVTAAIDTIISTVQALLPVIAAVAGAIAALQVVNKITEISTALSALTIGPVGLVIAAVAAIGAALVGLYATNEGFRNSVNELFATISTTMQPIIDGIVQGLTTLGTYIAETFGPALQTLGEGLSTFFSNLGTTFQPVMDAFVAACQMIGDAFNTSVMPALQAVQPVLSAVAAVLAGVVGPALQTVAGIASGVFASAFTIAGSIISGAMQVISGAVQAAVGIIETIVGVFVGVFTGDWQMAADGASNVMSGLEGILSGIMNGILGTISGILQSIVSAFSSILGGIGGIVSGIFGGLANAIGGPMEDAKRTVSGALDAIKGFFSGLHISWPHIPVPHFSIEGSFSLDPPSIPHIGVSVYGKGGIVGSAAVLGEAGAEAIVPYTNSNIKPWAHALAQAAFGNEGDHAAAAQGPLVGTLNINRTSRSEILRDLRMYQTYGLAGAR